MVQKMAQTRQRNSRKTPAATSSEARRIEWATGLVSALIVAAMIAWVAWEALTETETPPAFTVTVTDRAAVESGYRIVFDVANTSPQTAATVVVRGEVLDGQTVIEDADVTFDYVPGRSKASGSLFFSQDPGTRTVRLRAIGFTDP